MMAHSANESSLGISAGSVVTTVVLLVELSTRLGYASMVLQFNIGVSFCAEDFTGSIHEPWDIS